MSFKRWSGVRHEFLIGMCIVVALLLGCEAERDNPLDPQSPYYTGTGEIVGWVKTRTGEPISEMMLIVEPETTACEFNFSNQDGFYEFRNVAAGSCNVIASMEGYARDSICIFLQVGRTDTADFFLDILPQFIDCRICTRHVLEKVYVVFEASVTDGDGPVDIESVVAWVTDHTDTIDLNYDSETGTYWKIVDVKDLPVSSVEDLIGKDCFFLVRDKAGQDVASEPVRLARVIYPVPDIISPINFEKVGKNPSLIWHQTNLSYPFTYTVELMDYEGGVPLAPIWVKKEIPSTDTSAVVPLDLSPDIYSWAIWVVDEFGNRSRSKQAGFEVQ